jgi:hypothetical protein
VIMEMRTNRDHDGPVVRGDVHPDLPHPGGPDCALSRLRRFPGPGRRDQGTASGSRSSRKSQVS